MPALKRNLAKSLRRRAPLNEVRLWALLRDRSLDGLKFRRQVPLGSYVVDFISFRHRLVVEADGPFHDAERDAVRDAWLVAQGFRVLRFANAQIEVWPDRVLDEIRAVVGMPRIYSGPLRDEGRA
jgi:very-short-patch-repair endonuclease